MHSVSYLHGQRVAAKVLVQPPILYSKIENKIEKKPCSTTLYPKNAHKDSASSIDGSIYGSQPLLLRQRALHQPTLASVPMRKMNDGVLEQAVRQAIIAACVAVCVVLCCWAWLPVSLQAQAIAASDSAKVLSLDELSLEELLNVPIVTATKTAVKLVDVPAASSVITRQDILRYGYRNLSEALARIPEAYMHYEGHNFGVDFRGFFANNVARRTLYLINGHRINDRFHFGDFYPDVVGDLQDVEQIEVIRGPGAALYGSVALLGVVNIITRDARTLSASNPTQWDFSLTADDIAGTGVVTKGQVGVRHRFSDNVSLALSTYWFNGESIYDSKTGDSPRSWTSSETQDGAGVFNIISRTDAYFDLPRSTLNGFSSERFRGGMQLPGFNARLTLGDFIVGGFLHTRITSWMHPKDNATPNHPDNTRSWGTHAVFAEWKPKGALENLDMYVRISYNVNTNREIADFSLLDSIRNAQGVGTASLNASRIPGQFANANIFVRAANGRFIQYINYIDRTQLTDAAARLNGGGSQFNYAGVSKSLGIEGQITPYKSKELNISLGGNYENADYENIQWFAHRNGNFIGWSPGGGIYDRGWYIGGWAQVIWNPIEPLTVTAGARYDYQIITDVGRQIGRDLRYDRVIRGTDTSYLPFRVQNRTASDFTPRIAVNYRFSNDANLRLIYAQAFRAVPPQEVIRLPRDPVTGDIPNAESEKLNTFEAIFSTKLGSNVNLTVNGFYMNGNVVYAFNPSTQSFNRGSGWSNAGGSVALNYIVQSGIELWANATYYALNRSTDAFGFMRDWKTQGNPFLPNQFKPLDSPTLLAKAGASYMLPSQTSFAGEVYFNGGITMITPVNNNLGDPSPAEPGQPNFREYTTPSSFSINLTIRQDLEPLGMKGFFVLLKGRNLLNTPVWNVMQMDAQGSWNNNTFVRPNQIPDFGRQLYIQLGYTL
jgi:outer membrane receptor protein involved in Fe transport